MKKKDTRGFLTRAKKLFIRDMETSWSYDVVAMFTYAATLGAIVCLLFLNFQMPDLTFCSLIVALISMNVLSVYYLCLHSRWLILPLIVSLTLPFLVSGSDKSFIAMFIVVCTIFIVISLKMFFLTFALLLMGAAVGLAVLFDNERVLPIYIVYGGLFLLVTCIIFPWTTRQWSYLFPKPRARLLTREERDRIGQRGFTLIELLIVVAIIGIVSAGVVRLIGHHEVSSDYLRNIDLASMLAASEMEVLVDKDDVSARQEGQSPLPVEPSSISPLNNCSGFLTLAPGPTEGLFTATVTIHWKDRSGEHLYTLDRLFERRPQ